MKTSQVACTVYTIRDFMQTPSDMAASLKKVKAIGYPAVQISAIGPIENDELARILDGEGLVCCATHEKPPVILDEPNKVIDKLNALDCKYTAFPSPGGIPVETAEDVRSLAAGLNESGKTLFESGKILTYHNHNIEFRRHDGQLMLEVLYALTDPRYLQGEIDTYWVQNGGGDSVDWCNRMKGRLPLLHMKDYMITPEREPMFAEIGQGNLDFKAIIQAAEASGCEWFIVEQDICPGDPFDSLKISFDYITANLTED